MFTDLNVFQLAHAMASHAGKRQAVVARNIANADTPGYRAADIGPFQAAFDDGGGQFSARTTRTGHFGQAGGLGPHWGEFHPELAADPNGNSVSVEEEMLKAVEVKRQHDRALAIYRSNLTVLRTALGRG